MSAARAIWFQLYMIAIAIMRELLAGVRRRETALGFTSICRCGRALSRLPSGMSGRARRAAFTCRHPVTRRAWDVACVAAAQPGHIASALGQAAAG